MEARVSEYLSIGKQQEGFVIRDILGGTPPCWLDHTLLHETWNAAVCYGQIGLVMNGTPHEKHIVQTCLTFNKFLLEFEVNDYRHLGGVVTLLPSLPGPSLTAECDVLLRNNIRVALDERATYELYTRSLDRAKKLYYPLGKPRPVPVAKRYIGGAVFRH